jgi:hypothetical protein
MIDEYYRLSDFEKVKLNIIKQARIESKSKEKELPFKGTVYGGSTFERDKFVYGEMKGGSNSSRKSYEIKCAKHESAFTNTNQSQ